MSKSKVRTEKLSGAGVHSRHGNRFPHDMRFRNTRKKMIVGSMPIGLN